MAPHPRPARTFGDVEAFLGELGEPAPGRRRVYRGQTRAHFDSNTGLPTITPALARQKRPDYDPAWHARLTDFLKVLDPSDAGSLPVEFHLVWAPALIQHYGPGSHFVDVTFDVATALWFSTHVWHQRWLSIALAHRDRGTFDRWISTAWYTELGSRAQDRPVLYVFDLPEWDGMVVPTEVEIVNLEQSMIGEWLAANATRLSAQRAALLHAQWAEGNDVGPFVRASIALAGDFDASTVPGLQRTTRELFPPPLDDRFYDVLLRLPAQIQFQPTHLEHPLNVPCYLSEEPNVWQAVAPDQIEGTGERFDPAMLSWSPPPGAAPEPWWRELHMYVQRADHVNPPLLHAALARVWGNPNAVREFDDAIGDRLDSESDFIELRGQRFVFADALPIVLESVLYLSAPAVGPGERSLWIESSLSSGIADGLEQRSTANVFLELSPIDYIDPTTDYWTRIPRAIWLARRAVHYATRLFWQDEYGVDAEDFEFEFDAAGVGFVLKEGDTAFTDVARKALFVTLALLRDLSDGWKPVAFAWGSVSIAEATELVRDVLLVPQRGRLVRIARGRYFTPRDLSGRPYTFAVHSANAGEAGR
jgi:hypothetical protein